MKTRYFAAVLVALSMTAGHLLNAADKEFKANCPVSGGPAKESSSLDYKGKKVYFCCNNCPKKFAGDPEKFAAKANRQLAQTGQLLQVACPLSGQPCKAEQKCDVDGTDVYFCCEKCKGKAAGAEDKIALIFGDISKGFTLQTTCPISGKAIKTDKFVEHDGKKVYFCCGGCPDAFKKDPAKYTAKLPQFSETK